MFFEENNLYTAGDRGYQECRIPALITTNKGTILAFNEARKFTGRDSDQIDLFLRRSFDDGKSFEDVQVIASLDGWVSGNPSPVQDRNTGIVWLLFCRNLQDKAGSPRGQDLILQGKAPRQIWVTSSDDDGATWAKPKEITGDVKRDKWSWYATGPGHGIQLKSGRLIVACDHTEMVHEDSKIDWDYSHVIYSDDHGAHWKIGGNTDRGANESMILETADGWLYINSRNQFFREAEGPARKAFGPGFSYHRRIGWSHDNGEWFSSLVRDGGLPEPICQASVCRYTLESDSPKGRGRNRVLFSNPGNEKVGERHHLTVRLSYDECRTWPISKVIYKKGASYSDLCIAQDGTICCLYEKGGEGGISAYSGDTVFARFNLEWLTDGEDALS